MPGRTRPARWAVRDVMTTPPSTRTPPLRTAVDKALRVLPAAAPAPLDSSSLRVPSTDRRRRLASEVPLRLREPTHMIG